MRDSAHSPSGPDQGHGAIGTMFGLDEAETRVLGRLFTEITRGMGVNGEAIFNRLDAGASLLEALNLPPGIVDLLYARAHQWFGVGRIDKAEGLFRTLCILEPRPDHWVGYGVCLSLRGEVHEAEDAFRTAARLKQDWAVPHFHLAGLSLRLGAWDEAAQSLAAYDRHADDALPPAIVAEAERLRVALSLQTGRSIQAGAGS